MRPRVGEMVTWLLLALGVVAATAWTVGVTFDVRFASAAFPALPLAVGFALVAAFALETYSRRRTLHRIGDPAQLGRMMATYSPARRVVKAVLVTLGATLLAIAICEPERQTRVLWSRRGIDVVVAMDMSKSMLVRDVYPDRLTRMTEEVELLLDSLESDRVAVVPFAGGAVHFPLSQDKEAARGLFRALITCPTKAQRKWPTWCAPRALAPGSDPGEALVTARCVLRPDLHADPDCIRVGSRGHGGDPLGYEELDTSALEETTEPLPDRARALVMFTDGEGTQGNMRAELQRAVQLGIDVFIVGVGTTKGELIPEYDDDGNELGWKKSADGKSLVSSRLDERGLRELAETVGGVGHYISLASPDFDVAVLVAALRELKQGDRSELRKQEWTGVFEWPLFAAFMLLLTEAVVSGRRRRVIYPEVPRS